MTASIPDVEQAKLAAIQALRQELPQLLSTEESRQLEAKLAEVLSKADDPAELPQAIALAFDAIKRHPQAFQRLQEIARQARMAEGEVRFGGYGYHPPRAVFSPFGQGR